MLPFFVIRGESKVSTLPNLFTGYKQVSLKGRVRGRKILWFEKSKNRAFNILKSLKFY